MNQGLSCTFPQKELTLLEAHCEVKQPLVPTLEAILKKGVLAEGTLGTPTQPQKDAWDISWH